MKRWMIGCTAALLLAGLAGCSKPEPSVPTAGGNGEKVNLVDPNYPIDLAQEAGWRYRRYTSGDLDGDGAQEKVFVATTTMEDRDDGQVWRVYVTEADGTRTDLFSRWVQFGNLQVSLSADETKPEVLILEYGGNAIAVYSVRYQGPGKAEATRLVERGTLRHANEVVQ